MLTFCSVGLGRCRYVHVQGFQRNWRSLLECQTAGGATYRHLHNFQKDSRIPYLPRSTDKTSCLRNKRFQHSIVMETESGFWLFAGHFLRCGVFQPRDWRSLFGFFFLTKFSNFKTCFDLIKISATFAEA